ncbi:MAG: LysR substrate-binding domain-containing protein [Pseudomonadota bacterium]
MTHLPSPNWLRTFEAAARLGGFTAAGTALGLTPAAVSQQIRALESHLGFRLFERQARGVALTEMGQAYLPSVRRAFEDLEAATAGLFGGGGAAAVTVRAPISFTALCLVPRLADFHARFPAASVRLCTALWAETAEDSTIDLDIRYGDGQWNAAEVVRLSAPVSVLVCPPDTAAGSQATHDPAPEHPAALLRQEARRAIQVSGYESFWAALCRQHGLDGLEVAGTLAADSSLIALEMVAGGLGAAIIARDLAASHLSAGRVVAPAGCALTHRNAHYLIRPHREQAPSPDALLFRDWLLSQRFDHGAA